MAKDAFFKTRAVHVLATKTNVQAPSRLHLPRWMILETRRGSDGEEQARWCAGIAQRTCNHQDVVLAWTRVDFFLIGPDHFLDDLLVTQAKKSG